MRWRDEPEIHISFKVFISWGDVRIGGYRIKLNMIIDQAKMAMQIFKMKKEVESQSYKVEENGIEVEIAGFMTMSEPKIKFLKVNGIENKVLLETLNKALKKSTEASMKKMKDLGEGLKGAM